MYLSLSNFPAVGLQAHVASLGCLRPFPQRAVETNIPLAVAYVNISGPSAPSILHRHRLRRPRRADPYRHNEHFACIQFLGLCQVHCIKSRIRQWPGCQDFSTVRLEFHIIFHMFTEAVPVKHIHFILRVRCRSVEAHRLQRLVRLRCIRVRHPGLRLW